MLVTFLFHIILLLAFIKMLMHMHMVTYVLYIDTMQIIDRAAILQATGTSILPPKTKQTATLPSKITAVDDFRHKVSKLHNSGSHKITTDDRKYAVSAKTDSESNTSDIENAEQKVISHVSKGMHIHKESS